MGGPAGARLGFSVGALLGGALFPPRQAAQSIGRLSDLKITGSSYGTTIPMVWGDFALPGIIHDYVTDVSGNFLIEHSKKKGSKLTGTARVYSYTASFAALVCRGPVSIRRIWAQDRTLYDVYAYPPSAYTLRLYRGDETQQPDSLLVTQHGATATPAYRGLCYVVFQDLNLAEWGNQLPNLVFEVAQTYPDLVLTTAGLYSYYRFDNEGGKLSDIGPKGVAFTETSPASTQVPGCFRVLPGATAGGVGLKNVGTVHNDAPTGQDLSFQGPTFSIEGWFQYKGDPISGAPNVQWSYINPSTGEYSWQLSVQPNLFLTMTVVTLKVFTNASGITTVFQVSLTRDTSWHHVVATYNQAGSAQLYVDGALQTTVGAPVNPITITSNAGNKLRLDGGDYNVDEIAFYTTVMAAGDVTAHYQEAAGIPRTRTSPTVGAILADQFGQEGAVSSQWDTTAATEVVNGYVVTDRQSAREALDPLLRVYKTLVAEYDGKLVAVKRGGAAVATISASDLGAEVWTGSNTAVPKAVGKRLQELELPFRVDLSYFSKFRKYELATQGAERYTKTYLQDPVTITAPLVLTEDQARQAAEQQLYQVWTEREQFTFSLPLSYLYLAPGDVVNLPVLGQTFRVRIIQMDVDLPGPIHCTAVLDDIGILTQTIPGASVITSGEEAADVLSTTLIAWSGNALLDTDADSIGLYLAAGPTTAGYWPGATVYWSTDSGASYQEFETVSDATTIGTASTVLAAGTVAGAFDTVNTVDIAVTSGSAPVTTSDADVIAGSNAALLGDEVIQFATVTALGGSSYRLSRLLRGRRGTDGRWSEHRLGERFALLDSGLVKREGLGNSYFGRPVLIKAVTPGQAITDVTATTVLVEGLEKRCYAPCQLSGSRDGPLNLTAIWTRRDRKAGTGLPSPLTIPMSEATEAYAVDILAGSPKTITAITAAAIPMVTSASHGFTNGQKVYFTAVLGMTQLNGLLGTVSNALTNSFQLSDVSTLYFTAYVSGGTAERVVRSFAATSPTQVYSAASQVSDFGGTQSSVRLVVTQTGANGRGYAAFAVL